MAGAIVDLFEGTILTTSSTTVVWTRDSNLSQFEK